jgi:hypothetical protein
VSSEDTAETAARRWVDEVDERNARLIAATRDAVDLVVDMARIDPPPATGDSKALGDRRRSVETVYRRPFVRRSRGRCDPRHDGTAHLFFLSSPAGTVTTQCVRTTWQHVRRSEGRHLGPGIEGKRQACR